MVQFHDVNGYPKSQKVAVAPVPSAASRRFPPQSTNRMFSFFRPRRGTPPPKHSQDNIFRSACFETPQKTKRLSRRQAQNEAATDNAARFEATTAAKPAAKSSAGKPASNPSSMSRFGERFLRGVIFIKRSRRPYHTKADDSPTYAAGYSAGQLSLTASEQTDEDTICSSHDTAEQEPEATAEANGTASRFSSTFSSIVAQSPSAVPSKAHLKHPTVTRRGFFHSLARRRRCMENPVSTQLAVHSVHHSPHRHPKLPRSAPIIGPQKKPHLGRHTLVLDLDETLVHSSFVKIPNYSFVIPVEIEGRIHSIYVTKRPGVDIFLNSVSRYYEVVIFTASLAKYADPLLDILDPKGCCAWRLFRESCVIWNGQFVKDLSKLGRDLRKVVILDNSPASYVFQPGNAIPIETWIDDLEDSELYELIPLLEALRNVDDIPSVLWRTLQND